MSVPQVLTETTSNGTTISYEYGLERIAAYSENSKTSYIHDAGGSVIQTVSENSIKNYSYTPFGEQLSEAVSGFGYNAEWYDAATGMQYLRARFYEPMTMRFSQQDILRGSVSDPISLNRYLYCHNDPLSFSDPTGMSVFEKLGSALKSTVKAVKSTAKAATAGIVSSAAKVGAKVASTVRNVSTTVAKVSGAAPNIPFPSQVVQSNRSALLAFC